MRFSDYLERLSEELGEHQLPISPSWSKASQIVADDAIQHGLMKEVISAIYRANGCSNGGQPVALEPVLDCLGEIHHRLLESTTPDFEAVRLVQQIGETTVRLLAGDDGISLQPDADRRRSG